MSKAGRPTRPVQYFSDEQLGRGRDMTAEQVVRFLDDFRQLVLNKERPPRTTISMRVPDPLLRLFRHKAAAEGVRYQTQIQRLMKRWVEDPDAATESQRVNE